MVKFGGVGITDKEVVKGKCGGMGVVAEKHGSGCFGEAVLGKDEGDKTKLRQEANRLGKARDSLEDITE